MIILHASFLPQSDGWPSRFVIWGEAMSRLSRRPPGKRGHRIGTTHSALRASSSTLEPHAHPFAATTGELIDAIKPWAPELDVDEVQVIASLPAIGGRPSASVKSTIDLQAADVQPVLEQWRVPGLGLAPCDALNLLVRVPAQEHADWSIAAGSDVAYWRAAARFVLELLAGGRFKPGLVKRDANTCAVWQPLLESTEDRDRYDKLAAAMPPSARAVSRDLNGLTLSSKALLGRFLHSTVDEFARGSGYRRSAGRGKHRDLGQALVAALSSENSALEAAGDFIQQFRNWSQPPDSYRGGNARICFRLQPPPKPAGEGASLAGGGSETWALQYLLQAEDDPSLLVPARTVWRERGADLKFLNRKFEHPQERLLAGLGAAERVFTPIGESLRQARPELCSLTSDQAYSFIKEASVLLSSNGFGVLLPGIGKKLTARLRVSPKPRSKGHASAKSLLSMDRLVDFDWEVAIGGHALTRAEFEKLVSLKMPLVQVRGEWVELNPRNLQKALDYWKKMESGPGIGLAQVIEMALGPDGVPGLPISDVEASGWVGDVLKKLKGEASVQQLKTPRDFEGTLRHYQKHGFSWLAFLREFGLGGCLADDMGLGKTIQTIALLLELRRTGLNKPSLLICPTSVVGNWHRELGRFAPSLRVLIHHGTRRERADFGKLAAVHDIVISSYSLLHRDEQHLSEVAWGELILDEAQNIKNPDTRQAGAARRLTAEHRIALTGTPIENRLSELWSIFEFLNPGYLGPRKSFRTTFELPIERTGDKEAARRLKSLSGPFILRRVKTDKSVIKDLPDKNEMKVFCGLTREQATLYEAVVRDSLKVIAESDGIKRRGVVLATLMKLKQVCNHPAQFLGDGSALDDRSGKLNRLAEMLEEARSVGDRALIFTQFAEMGELLKSYLQRTFGREVSFLHGGTPVRARQAMIDRFQDDPDGPFAFILSIKAGGTGLNLTRASHVFHYDRWWNPAVENQATDRAFRIGQKRNVQVYKYICGGTVEEHVDEMIESKKALADNIVGTSEGWITELGTEKLRDLFKLRKEVID
jgi:SNF2 family DNA or RNA helicase